MEDRVLTVSFSQELQGCFLFPGHYLTKAGTSFCQRQVIWVAHRASFRKEGFQLQEQCLLLDSPWAVYEKGNTSNQLSEVLTPFTTHKTTQLYDRKSKVTSGTKSTAKLGCVRRLILLALRLVAVRKAERIIKSSFIIFLMNPIFHGF